MKIPGSRLGRWLVKGSRWGRGVRLLAALVLLYSLYACVTMRRPPIRGVVVDKETGRPVAGAEICGGVGYTVLFPSETADKQRGGGAYCVADGQGRFYLPAMSGVMLWPERTGTGGWILPNPLYLVLVKWATSIELIVHSQDYVTVDSKEEARWWKRETYRTAEGDSRAAAGRPSPVSLGMERSYWTVKRFRLPVLGYWYRIELVRARTQADWEGKCRLTQLATQRIDSLTADRWIFDDLTGYLERWPKGEKAGVYIVGLGDLGMALYPDYCDPGAIRHHSRQDLEKALGMARGILRSMDGEPITAVTSDPITIQNWPAKREAVVQIISILEQEVSRRKGANDAK